MKPPAEKQRQNKGEGGGGGKKGMVVQNQTRKGGKAIKKLKHKNGK
jgi:hypothetical protein